MRNGVLLRPNIWFMGKERVLVTGAAGFIGFQLSRQLVAAGYSVVGIDNMNSYYEVSLKETRLEQLVRLDSFEFIKLDLIELFLRLVQRIIQW